MVQEDLLRSFAAKAKLGEFLPLYTVVLRFARPPRVFQRLDLCGACGCESQWVQMRVDTTIADRYSGTIGRKQVSPTQNLYRISADFLLTPEIAQSLRVIKARPVQLNLGTHAVYADHQQCVLNWIEVRSERAEIHVIESTNDIEGYDGFVQDFDGSSDRFLLPVSSQDAGIELITKLQDWAGGCRH